MHLYVSSDAHSPEALKEVFLRALEGISTERINISTKQQAAVHFKNLEDA